MDKSEMLGLVFSPEFISNSGLKRDDIFFLAFFIRNESISKEDVIKCLGLSRRIFYYKLSNFRKLNLIELNNNIININQDMIHTLTNLYNIQDMLGKNEGSAKNCTENRLEFGVSAKNCTELVKIRVGSAKNCTLCRKIDKISAKFCTRDPKISEFYPPLNNPPIYNLLQLELIVTCNKLNVLYNYLIYNLYIKEKKENITPFIPLLKEKKEMENQVLQGEIEEKFNALLNFIESHEADIWRENFTRRYGVSPSSVFARFKSHVIGNCLIEELFKQKNNKILAWFYNSAKSWLNESSYKAKESNITPERKIKLGVGEFMRDGKRYYRLGDKAMEVPLNAPQRYDDRVKWEDGRWKFIGAFN